MDMSHGSAACKGRSKRAKQSSPDSPTTPEPSDNGFAALSEPEQGARCDEDATHDDEVEGVGEQVDNNPAQEGLTDDLLDADSSQDTLNDDPVRITTAIPFRTKLEGCMAADSTPPPSVIVMFTCRRPLGPSRKLSMR